MSTMPEATARVMIVEDEPKLAQLLADYLAAASYATTSIANGLEVVPAVRAEPPDLILLDLMLPGKDGVTILSEIRGFSSVPIVMVTARVEEIDRLLGLELGADDYICKPFSPREVVARVKAILRRAHGARPPQPQQEPMPQLLIDEERFEATLDGHPLGLTPVEFRLLKTLAAQPGHVFARQKLLDQLYADHRVVSDRTVDSHVKNLRRKLQEASPDVEMIRSIYGVGYKLEL